jgi:hypothetical protein
VTIEKTTKIVVGVTVVGLLLYDILPAFDGKPGGTISETVRDSSKKHPAISFSLGFLMGHLFG